MSTQNTEFILVLLFIYYCIIFHMNNCKSTFVSLCTYSGTQLENEEQVIYI